MTTCPDCLRPLATIAQWSNGHGDGNGCECPECVSVCWGDAMYCAKVKAERERKPSNEERYRKALEQVLVAVDRDGPNAGDSSLMLWQADKIARAALKG